MIKKQKDKTIFQVIIGPLIAVFILIVSISIILMYASGVFAELDTNAKEMLSQYTKNRTEYLQNEMLTKWSDFDATLDIVNTKVQSSIESGEFSVEDFEDQSKCAELLDGFDTEILDLVYRNQVNGVFLIFNSYGNDWADSANEFSGIYVRDLDVNSHNAYDYSDILVERAPDKVVINEHLTLDKSWSSGFTVEDLTAGQFFNDAFYSAVSDQNTESSGYYGYWNLEPYTILNSDKTAISYSVPLILEDGTVYGVLGVEILTEYIAKCFPNNKLFNGKSATYMLAGYNPGTGNLIPEIFANKDNEADYLADEVTYNYDVTEETVSDSLDKYYTTIYELDVYDNEAYQDDSWYVLGTIVKKDLYVFSARIRNALIKAAVISLIIGIIVIAFVSYKFSKPIRKLSKEVEKSQKDNTMPSLSKSGIREIDHFATSITSLGNEVINSSTRFLNIMNMASVEIGGYEINGDSDLVFVTENYFPMLGMRGVDIAKLTKEKFEEYINTINQNLSQSLSEKGETIYAVPQIGGGMRYYRSEVKRVKNNSFGLLEDVTSSVLEKKRIEHERDCDGLTEIYNGQGFRRKAKEILSNPSLARCAAIIMMDLDNLKMINDTYGHSYGDKYIKAAAKCFDETIPSGDLCARVSGDEFVILFHGYDSKDELIERVEEVYNSLREVKFHTPNGENRGLSLSGGITFYPSDSTDLTTLMKYADFAMYTAKKMKKGGYCEFDHDMFMKQIEKNQLRADFNQLVDSRKINYHFQPIFSSRDASVYAYEALMRVDIPSLRSPLTVISLAKENNRLNDIEEITMFCSSECFKKLKDKQKIYPGAKLFVNSIANACMSESKELSFHALHSDIQNEIVIEITESENLSVDCLERKKRAVGFNGAFALDDFGSGYNNEINLLELNPKYIKLDISIIRDIDKNADKQQLVRSTIQYAHERNMLVVAEGIENEGELKKVLELEADLLQGYFLARPDEIPKDMNSEAKRIILSNNKIVE